MSQIIVAQKDPTPGVEPTHCRPDWSKIHQTLLRAIIETNPEISGLHIVIDPNLDPEKAKKAEWVGVFKTKFAGFTLTLNWTPVKQQSLPPRHISVECLGEVVGIIGPYHRIRKCWKCDLEGYRDPQCTVPWVEPGLPCPRCGALDWWGRIVTPWHVMDRAAEVVAKELAFDQYWTLLDGDGAQRRLKGGLT